ncbi:MAG: aa3-type cytochrome c oxidase subunit IV [Pseudomonadota bacterium]|nr:aa3-type cytochrome c oxidase subunit IV [Pseudomonadota bacterium]
MAAEGNTPEDFKAHFKSYSSFATMMKWGTILSFITGMVVVVIISS